MWATLRRGRWIFSSQKFILRYDRCLGIVSIYQELHTLCRRPAVVVLVAGECGHSTTTLNTPTNRVTVKPHNPVFEEVFYLVSSFDY